MLSEELEQLKELSITILCQLASSHKKIPTFFGFPSNSIRQGMNSIFDFV
jgi:hypothetical protein